MFAFALIIYRWLLLAFQPLFAAPPGAGSISSDTASPTTPAIVPSSSSSNINNVADPLATRVAELEEMMRQQASQPRYPAYLKEPKINSPSPFKGNKAEAEEFILKCQSVFDICSRTYHDDQTKLAFVFNLLQGDAYQWVKPALLTTVKPSWVQSWVEFQVEFFKNFADSDVKETSQQKLKHLKQTGSASSYATDFKKYALYLDWSDEALRQSFFDGLKIDVQDRLLSPQRFTSFTELVDSATEWDSLLFQRRKALPLFEPLDSASRSAKLPDLPPSMLTRQLTPQSKDHGLWISIPFNHTNPLHKLKRITEGRTTYACTAEILVTRSTPVARNPNHKSSLLSKVQRFRQKRTPTSKEGLCAGVSSTVPSLEPVKCAT